MPGSGRNSKLTGNPQPSSSDRADAAACIGAQRPNYLKELGTIYPPSALNDGASWEGGRRGRSGSCWLFRHLSACEVARGFQGEGGTGWNERNREVRERQSLQTFTSMIWRTYMEMSKMSPMTQQPATLRCALPHIQSVAVSRHEHMWSLP